MLLLHEGGQQNAPFSRGFMDVNKCENFTGPDLLDVVNRLDPAVDVVVSAHTHQPYVCTLQRPARHVGRVVRPADHVDRPDDRPAARTRWSLRPRTNHVVTQTVAKDPGVTAILAEYKKISDPIGNRVIGSITADILSGPRHGQRHEPRPASSRWAT